MFARFSGTTVVVLLCSACASMGSRDALVSDRPDFTESAAVVDPKHVQVESGTTYSEEGARRSVAVGEVLTRVGLRRGLELRVAGNSWAREEAIGERLTGREDAGLGIKYVVSEGPDTRSWTPSLSVIAGSSVPTGSDVFRSVRAQPEVKIITGWTLAERWSFTSNVNVARPFDGTRSFTEYAGSGSFGYAATGRMGVYAEAFAFAPQDGSHTVDRFVNGGVTFLFSPDVQLDVRAGAGPSRRASDYFAGIGLVVRR